MWNRGARSAALERAQAQLSGRRMAKPGPEARDVKDTTDSMDAVAKRKTRELPLPDLSDLSSEGTASDDVLRSTAAAAAARSPSPPPPPESPGAGAGGRGSRFLKKAPVPAAASSLSPALSHTRTQHHEPRYVTSSQRSSHNATLSKLALIEERIRSRQQQQARETPQSPQSPQSPAPVRGSTPSAQAQDTPSARAGSSLNIEGKRFLKSKAPPTVPPAVPTALESSSKTSGSARALFGAGAGQGGVSLDSDEEDMRKLLGGGWSDSPDDSLLRDVRARRTTRESLKKGRQKVSPSPPAAGRSSSVRARSRTSPSPSSPRRASPVHPRPQQTPAPSMVLAPTPPGRGSPRARPLRRTPSSVSSLEELFPEALGSLVELCPEALGSLVELCPEALGSLAELCPEALDSDDAISERSGMSDDFKINIMSLDDLAPTTLGASETAAEKKRSREGRQKRQAPGGQQEAPGPSSQLEDLFSGVQLPQEAALDYDSDFESEIETATAQSASEISERLGDEAVSGRSFSNSASLGREDACSASQSEKSSRSQSRSYAARRTHPSRASLSGRTLSRASSSSSSRPPSHSDSMSRTVTPPPRSRARPRHPARREAGVQTQPDGLTYYWSNGMAALGPAVGMAYKDPAPVASHTVSAEAVEALSAYSPAVFALNDMLRQQLGLTRRFVQASRHLHSSMLLSLEPAGYEYTTLEDTREFIRCHKPPKLTMEEALQEVLQEIR